MTLNRSLFETVLRDLLLDGTERTVELYEETGRQGWKLGRTASPGKLGAFEEELYRTGEMADTPIVAAVRVVVKAEQRLVGVVGPAEKENRAFKTTGATEHQRQAAFNQETRVGKCDVDI